MRAVFSACVALAGFAVLASCSPWISRRTDGWIEERYSNSTSDNGVIPVEEGLPDSSIRDLVYPDTAITVTMTARAEEGFGGMVLFETDIPVDSIISFYDNLYTETDWAVRSSMESTHDEVRSVVYEFTKGDGFTALVTVQEEKGKTSISIIYREE